MQVEKAALEHLGRLLADAGLGDSVGLRLCVAAQREVELAPDRIQPDDRVLRIAQRPVLLLDPEVEQQLEGGVLRLEGEELRLRWPA